MPTLDANTGQYVDNIVALSSDNAVITIETVGNAATWTAQITGTFSGTLTFYGSVDRGATYNAIADSAGATSTTTTGMHRGDCAGYTHIQIKMHPYVSGTATVQLTSTTGDIADWATLLTLAGTPTDANTVNSLMGRLTKIRDLLNATLTVQGTITEANSASIKNDLDTIVTNTNKIPASPAQEGGNLATVATNTGNTATGVGGVADSAYASGSGSIIAILKGIFGRIGATLGFDNTNVLKISNYGKNSAAGDTAILVDSTGRTLIGRSTVALFTLASTATSGSTQNSSDLTVSPYTEIGIDITTTAQSGTNPTIQYFYERKGADGLYYPLWQSAVLTAASNTLSTSIGVGMAYNQSLGLTGRLRWVIGGSATPTYTHQINMYAK